MIYSSCVTQSWWKCCLSVKQPGSGWDTELLGVSSGSRMFAYDTLVVTGRLRVKYFCFLRQTITKEIVKMIIWSVMSITITNLIWTANKNNDIRKTLFSDAQFLSSKFTNCRQIAGTGMKRQVFPRPIRVQADWYSVNKLTKVCV